jgi:excinuclease ABC subunit A
VSQPAEIEMIGVRTHNLKGVDVRIPLGSMTVITGPSGSGKSSLAFDTLYAEGQRRFVESLSAYTRQFLERMDRPDVERVSGIPPAIAVERRPPAKTSRSTVGTVTEILDYIRMMFARVAVPRCLGCGRDVERATTASVAASLLADHPGARGTIVFALRERLDDPLREALTRRGYFRLTRNGTDVLDLHEPHWENESDGRLHVVTDRLRIDDAGRTRLAEALEIAFREGVEHAGVFLEEGRYLPLARGLVCAPCDRAIADPSPLSFSFNSPMGACPTCRGFGDIIDLDPERVVPDPSKSLAKGAIAPWQSGSMVKWQRRAMSAAKDLGIPVNKPFRDLDPEHRALLYEGGPGFPGVRGFFAKLERKIYKLHVRVFLSRYRRYVTCHGCGGARLRPEAMSYRLLGCSIGEVCAMAVSDAVPFWRDLRVTGQAEAAARSLQEEILKRLLVMERAGLGYVSLDRPSRTLSGGEYQRILLAGALGSGLVGTLYVLDEPSVGLHARDGERLLGILRELRDAGNTVVVVEHDRDVIQAADHVIDLGPLAGERGGEIVYSGPPSPLCSIETRGATAEFLSGRQVLPARSARDLSGAPAIGIRNARGHNLRNLDIDIPLGGLVCVTGVSGSGKSTLVEDTLYLGYRAQRGRADEAPAPHDAIVGTSHVHDVLLVDQTPIGRTPRSNPVTYIKAFDGIRKLFSEHSSEAVRLGLTAGDFSFNVAGGRCESCEGAGFQRIELQFLADVFVTCEACRGRRYQERVLQAHYRGKSIHDVLSLTIEEAVSFFASTPRIARALWHLEEVGLGYLRLGQSATTLSGGEAQRLKIAGVLSKQTEGPCLLVLDEPTTGLHLGDIAKLLRAFERLIQQGHTVLVVEHNLDVIARADVLIDLGPEGGAGGGCLVARGSPEALSRNPASITGRYLAAYFERWGRPAPSKPKRPVPEKKRPVRRVRS